MCTVWAEMSMFELLVFKVGFLCGMWIFGCSFFHRLIETLSSFTFGLENFNMEFSPLSFSAETLLVMMVMQGLVGCARPIRL